ncbi:MAG: periplasmic heavy metal sensor [Deltaproteobacteria bacterium]|nr:periplasmic heavy metal sensor [Deltaproteobacteria bacterium]
MKKTLTIIGALLLVAAVAYPVLAWGPGWGGMHRGMGWGHGPGYCWNGGSGSGYGALNQEQATKLDQLRQNFYNDTTTLRNELWNKSRELNIALNAVNPDRTRITALQDEINDLRTQLSKKRLDFELEARKIAPNTGVAKGYGPGYGRGGHGMMGSGNHRGGFGGVPCWN